MAEVAERDTYPWPGSPIRPGTFASPEAVAAEAAAEAVVAAELPRATASICSAM